MDETVYVHTVDIETYETAFYAAVNFLKSHDLATVDVLRTLAEEDGVVGDAARHLLGVSDA